MLCLLDSNLHMEAFRYRLIVRILALLFLWAGSETPPYTRLMKVWEQNRIKKFPSETNQTVSADFRKPQFFRIRQSTERGEGLRVLISPFRCRCHVCEQKEVWKLLCPYSRLNLIRKSAGKRMYKEWEKKKNFKRKDEEFVIIQAFGASYLVRWNSIPTHDKRVSKETVSARFCLLQLFLLFSPNPSLSACRYLSFS